MTSTDITAQQRIVDLVAAISTADAAYAAGDPQILDGDYDALRDELAQLLAEQPDLTPDPNPLDTMWAPTVITAPVRHARPMLSLSKVAPDQRIDGITAFMSGFAPGVATLVMDKLDGCSASVVYEDGVLRHIATRGDSSGTVGENITAIAREVVHNIPVTINHSGTVEVRGEIVMLRETLATYNATNGGRGRVLMNTRSAAAGVLSLKDPAAASGRHLHFYAFDLDVLGSSRAVPGLDEELGDLGFTPATMHICHSVDEVLAAIANVEAQRPTAAMDTDGAVVRIADASVYAAAGERSKTPRAAIAVKFAPEEKVTTLLDVVWQVGAGGKIVPRAVLDRVLVAGTHITSATLANQQVIERRGLKIGQRVVLKRAGDVIPFISGPAPGEQPGVTTVIAAPTHCPSCADDLVERGKGRELFCTNLACPAQGARRLMHWASRGAADIDAIGEVWIQRLYDAGILTRPEHFYQLTLEQLLAFPGMGPVSARRMLESIDRSRALGLRRALIGFAIRHASEGTAKRVCRAGYESIELVAAATSAALQEIEDIGPTVGQSVEEFLSRPETLTSINALRAAGVNLDVLDEDRAPQASPDAPLAGETAVITGAVTHPISGDKVTRAAFGALVEQLGAKLASSVSASTTVLVCGANVGASKTGKAESLGVRVADQSEIWQLLQSAGLA